MADYSFHVLEQAEATVHSGGAQSDEAARVEAIQFLGEMLRDSLITEPGDISVAVFKDGKSIFSVSAVISRLTP